MAAGDLQLVESGGLPVVRTGQRQSQKRDGCAAGFGPVEGNTYVGGAIGDFTQIAVEWNGKEAGAGGVEAEGDFVGVVGELQVAGDGDDGIYSATFVVNGELNAVVVDREAGLG